MDGLRTTLSLRKYGFRETAWITFVATEGAQTATKPGDTAEYETQFADPPGRDGRFSRDPARAQPKAYRLIPWYSSRFGATGKDRAMNLLQDHEATCPHCWETISLTLDLSVPEQSYIEDCPVCCKPMLVSYSAADGEIDLLSVESSD
jgi:hypothetical protein